MKDYELKKRPLSCKNSSPGSKASFSEKFLFGIWRLIYKRYDVKRLVHDIRLNVQYIKGPSKHRYWISHSLRSIILNFLFKYVVFLMNYYIFCALNLQLSMCRLWRDVTFVYKDTGSFSWGHVPHTFFLNLQSQGVLRWIMIHCSPIRYIVVITSICYYYYLYWHHCHSLIFMVIIGSLTIILRECI